MDEKLKNFINENLDLINENTEESWEEVYRKLAQLSTLLIGKFTETMLSAKIDDPAILLKYIPKYYLVDSSIQQYTVPDTVTSIGNQAFKNCSSLTSIVIGNSVKDIDFGAFDGCRSLMIIKIPDSVTSIADSAFYYCTSLKTVVIPNSVTYIGDRVFYNCNSLTSVIIGDSVINIGDYAFDYCDILTRVTIPDSLRSIGDKAFSNCTKLKEIYFKGTKKQAIQLSIGNRTRKKWRENSAIEKIICTDGVIEL